MVTNLIQSDLTFRQSLMVQSLTLMGAALPPIRPGAGAPVALVYAENSSAAATTLNLSAFQPGESHNLSLHAGSWFGVTSSSPAAAHLYFVSGDAVRLEVAAPASGDWFRVMAPVEGRNVQAGDRYRQ
jgi:hypothetical protein|eukprot:COSAG06_NODE_304_length_17855_cov_47.399414_21_plen_128_part_00